MKRLKWFKWLYMGFRKLGQIWMYFSDMHWVGYGLSSGRGQGRDWVCMLEFYCIKMD